MKLPLILLAIVITIQAQAKIKTESVEYKDGDAVLQGYMAYDDAKSSHGSRPAVLIVHDWMGISEDTKMRAEQVAKMGYVGFAADIYGKGKNPHNGQEASALATQYKADRKVLRGRAQAAFDKLTSYPFVNKDKVVAIGFCFGGTTSLELARSGAPLVGTVSFHGSLDTPNKDDAKNIKGKVLVLHGADDPFVKSDEVLGFEDEMRKAKVDWQLMALGNSVHAFTVKAAGTDPSKGAAYNPVSEKRAWSYFQNFLKEVF